MELLTVRALMIRSSRFFNSVLLFVPSPRLALMDCMEKSPFPFGYMEKTPNAICLAINAFVRSTRVLRMIHATLVNVVMCTDALLSVPHCSTSLYLSPDVFPDRNDVILQYTCFSCFCNYQFVSFYLSSWTSHLSLLFL